MADGNEAAPGDEPPAEALSKKYDQAFFLALAAKGKDASNAWRRDPANKDRRVTFAGIDFREAPRDGIDFSGFEFGDNANFSACKWQGVEWAEVQKDPKAFVPGRACFIGAVFGARANFTRAILGNQASFVHANFGEYANFVDARFFSGANVAEADFGSGANFTGTVFGEQARFAASTFGKEAKFDKTHFKGSVAFNEPRCRFLNVSFADARFDGEANFSGCAFEQGADFGDVRFYYPPDFDGMTNAARIDFTGATIGFVRPGRLHWTFRSSVPVRLRALRKIAEETKNHDLERDLYIEERKAERGVYLSRLLELDELKMKLEDINEQQQHVWLEWRLQRRARNAHWLGILSKPVKVARLAVHGFWIGVMGLYWALADYGRNFLVPAIWLGLSVPFFDWRYTEVLARLMAKAPDVDKYKRAVGMLALGNAVPFVGPLTIDAKIKEFLFCPDNAASCLPPIPPEGFQFLVIAQNVLSIILVFFIGLALRNYFKIK
jgi:uncharacterized protein YjbI with pentapeptide repeats